MVRVVLNETISEKSDDAYEHKGTFNYKLRNAITYHLLYGIVNKMFTKINQIKLFIYFNP